MRKTAARFTGLLAAFVLEQVEEDLKVSLMDRARARPILVSFCSGHDSGTALPPPFGGWPSA
jgi:hypothetical protein